MSDSPSSGVRVLELGAFIAGPFVGQLLGDLGADVVKVEPAGAGDIMRRYGVRVDGRSLWWPQTVRNKRSLAVDLRDPRGQEAVRRVAAGCDVVLENFKPGTLAKWGMTYAEIAVGQPRCRARARFRLRRRDRAWPSPASARSARRWAGSGTRPASPTGAGPHRHLDR